MTPEFLKKAIHTHTYTPIQKQSTIVCIKFCAFNEINNGIELKSNERENEQVSVYIFIQGEESFDPLPFVNKKRSNGIHFIQWVDSV